MLETYMDLSYYHFHCARADHTASFHALLNDEMLIGLSCCQPDDLLPPPQVLPPVIMVDPFIVNAFAVIKQAFDAVDGNVNGSSSSQVHDSEEEEPKDQ